MSEESKVKGSLTCPHCGRELPGDSVFCTSCGKSLTKPADEQEQQIESTAAPSEPDKSIPVADVLDKAAAVAGASASTPNASDKVEPKSVSGNFLESIGAKSLSVVGVVAGILFAIIGLIIVFVSEPGCHTTSFGGDAYTYIYQGIVAIANTTAVMSRGIGLCLTAIGCFMGLHFATKLLGK